jgi:hypothetical protein
MKKFFMMLLAVAGLFIFNGCAEKDAPKVVAKKWCQAILNNDVNTAKALANFPEDSSTFNISEATANAVKKDSAEKAKIEKLLNNIDAAKEEIAGDFTFIKQDGNETPIMILRKINGNWKVNAF